VWEYREVEDERGREVNLASVKSFYGVELDFPYRRRAQAELTLRNRARRGKDVMLEVEKGIFDCNPFIAPCAISVRFDDAKRTKVFSVALSKSGSMDTVFIEDYARFVSSLRKAKRMTIVARFYPDGAKAMSFNVENLNWK
jgi:hypothetical protein